MFFKVSSYQQRGLQAHLKVYNTNGEAFDLTEVTRIHSQISYIDGAALRRHRGNYLEITTRLNELVSYFLN